MAPTEPESRTSTETAAPGTLQEHAPVTLPLPTTMPAHWRSEFPASRPWMSLLLRFAWSWMCAVATGGTTLDGAWSSIQTSEEAFQAYVGKLNTRISTISILAGLFLASITTLLTTTPPLPDLFDFHQRACYLLLILSFSIMLSALLAGFLVQYMMSTGCTRIWAVHDLCTTRPRMWVMLIIVGYPFMAFFWATAALMISLCFHLTMNLWIPNMTPGFLVAEVTSHDPIMIVVGAVFNLVPALLYLLTKLVFAPVTQIIRDYARTDTPV
ncbi:hypothetical protein C8J57DRAFT_1238447 [Mycena rebaudengoi]|nr:hypothetical protein C8J57DRAFT_1238447 [Mycena rebaudengoi]